MLEQCYEFALEGTYNITLSRKYAYYVEGREKAKVSVEISESRNTHRKADCQIKDDTTNLHEGLDLIEQLSQKLKLLRVVIMTVRLQEKNKGKYLLSGFWESDEHDNAKPKIFLKPDFNDLEVKKDRDDTKQSVEQFIQASPDKDIESSNKTLVMGKTVDLKSLVS